MTDKKMTEEERERMWKELREARTQAFLDRYGWIPERPLDLSKGYIFAEVLG